MSTSLVQIEDQLQALLDTADMVDEKQREQFETELIEAQLSAVVKRDNFAEFILDQQAKVDAMKERIKMLQDRSKRLQSAIDRAEAYATYAMERIGKVKLEGQLHTLRLNKCPDSVGISNINEIPAEFQTVAIEIPMLDYQAMLDELSIDAARRFTETAHVSSSPDKSAIKRELKNGVQVPGAALLSDKHTLKIS